MAGPGQPKTGGKVKGTKNKKTLAKELSLRDYCAAKGYDPVHAMIDVACDPTVDLDLRTDMHKEVAKYIHPRLSARELSLDADTRKALIHRYGRTTNGHAPALHAEVPDGHN